jgi:protein-S-isoprenylcysteine O-methyltransferase Ste14
MAIGTAATYGRVVGVAIFVAACGAFWWKSRLEEQIMTRHFPDAYPGYKKRVHALIPFVL